MGRTNPSAVGARSGNASFPAMNSLYGEQNNDHERDIRMSTENHFNIDDPKGGMPRELAPDRKSVV